MDFWLVIQERFTILAVFAVIILVSLFLLFSVWKNRMLLSKSLTAVVMGLGMIILVLALIAFIFILSFGYNA